MSSSDSIARGQYCTLAVSHPVQLQVLPALGRCCLLNPPLSQKKSRHATIGEQKANVK